MPIKSIFKLILLTTIPALIIELSYISFVNITDIFGLPNINALALSTLLVMLPIMIGIILFYSKKEMGYKSITNMIRYKNSINVKRFTLYSAILLGYGCLVFTFGKQLDNFIYEKIFSFIPENYILKVNPVIHTKTQLIITFFSAVFITGIIAPVVEEIYFRGFSLPRMEWMGVFAPIFNAVLFSFYHFWSPWQFVTRVIFLIPFCCISYKTKNIKLTIVVHCLLNIIGDGLGILLMIPN